MWILPSRTRPHNVKRFFEAWDVTKASTTGILCLDADDADWYRDVKLPDGWRVWIMKGTKGIGEILNHALVQYPTEPWYGIMGDDAVPLTDHWDKFLVEAAGDDKLSYGDDGLQGEALAAHPCCGGDLIRELGWLALPGCQRLYIDTALYDYAKKTNRLVYLPDVKVEHRHFSNGKAAYDRTYQKPSGPRDREIYEQWQTSL